MNPGLCFRMKVDRQRGGTFLLGSTRITERDNLQIGERGRLESDFFLKLDRKRLLIKWLTGTGIWEISLEAISKMPNGSISASGLNRNPQNNDTYSSVYDPAPSLTSHHFFDSWVGFQKFIINDKV